MGISMRWDLSNLYTSFDSKEFVDDTNNVSKMINEAKLWADKELIDSKDAGDNLIYIIKSNEAISGLLRKLGSFIHLTLATDATNKIALANMDRMQKVMLEATNLSTVLTRFIGSLDNLDELISASKELQTYEFYLKEETADAQHLLSPEVEPIIAKLGLTGADAWQRMRSMIDGTMMVDIKEDGEIKNMPLPIVRNMAYSSDPKVRKNGYEAELKAYPSIELALSYSMNAIKGEGIALCELRGYDSLHEKALEDSRMTKEILDAMLSATVDALPDFHRYLKAKARVLGHKGGLPFYDLFAPMGDSAKKFTYDEAHEFLVKTFSGFSSEMSEFIDNAFKKNWIDAESRPGKGGGAFCANLLMIGESRILTNFDGGFSQVSTLAHELGHAWHGHCLKHLPLLKTSYPMPLAETASIFNEGIVMDAALKSADDDEKFVLLEAELMKNTQVIVDIYSRYLFETDVIETRKDHGMTVDDMKESMINAQKKAYGDGLDENYLHPYMWACKTHYYIPQLAFYNWPYAFGLLFGKGVFAEYKKIGPSFVADYKELLATTGSANVADVAKRMNIDVTSKAFWKQSLDEITNDIDLFCELAENRIK